MTFGEMAVLTNRFHEAVGAGELKQDRLINFMNDLRSAYGFAITGSTDYAFQLYQRAGEEL